MTLVKIEIPASPAPYPQISGVEEGARGLADEVERLTSFLTDVDSKFGGLLFLFDQDGKRHIAEVGGAIIPVFKSTKVALAN